MLIWYANLPEEVAYYALRQTPELKPIFILNFLINFFVPFFILMTRDAKRQENTLIVAGVLMIIGHWLDVWLIVMPGIMGTHAHIGIVEISYFILCRHIHMGILQCFIRLLNSRRKTSNDRRKLSFSIIIFL